MVKDAAIAMERTASRGILEGTARVTVNWRWAPRFRAQTEMAAIVPAVHVNERRLLDVRSRLLSAVHKSLSFDCTAWMPSVSHATA